MSNEIDKDKTERILREVKRLKQSANNSIVDVEEQKTKLVIFVLFNNYYAIKAEYVKEILTIPNIAYVPTCPDFIRGVISVRGDIESVIDLHLLMEMPEIVIERESRLIIVQTKDMSSGILLDRLIDVLDVSNSKILPPLSTSQQSYFVEGGINFEDKYVILLDIGKIFQKICT